MTDPAVDKRHAARIPVNFDVSFTFGSREHRARALNLSPDGMFLHTEYMLLQDDLIEIYFHLPEVEEPLWMKARVAWGTRLEGQTPAFSGMGVQFLDPMPSQREEIERYLQRLQKKAEP